MQELIEELEREKANALDVEQRNREAGSSAQSVAFDSGRYAGLRDALEIVLRYAERQGI